MNISNTKYGKVLYWKNDYFIGNVLKTGKMYEEDVFEKFLAKHIKKCKIILDIGAHVGCHSLMYSKVNPTAEIHSFEVQKKMYELLKKNISLNNCQNVKIYNCAIGNMIKMVEINDTISDGPNTNLKLEYGTPNKLNLGGVCLGKGSEEQLMITIDSLELKECDFIKIDVEGFEPFVIMGALETIKKYKPVIFYEKNYKNVTTEMLKIAESESYEEVRKILTSVGYKIYDTIIYNYLAICEQSKQ